MTDAVLEEVFAELAEDRFCDQGCGWKLVSADLWATLPPSERQEMREDGYRAGSGDRCRNCRDRMRHVPVAERAKPWPPGLMLAQYCELREQGLTKREARDRLGVNRKQLDSVILRARKNGTLPREEWAK